MSMARVELEGVTKVYDDGTVAVDELSLVIEEGELLALLGPSGCGKSTVLRLLAGLETPTSGRILVDGRDVTGMTPQQRNVAMVFQSFALYPHKTVRANLEFPLRMRRTPSDEIAARVHRAASLLGLGDVLDRRPRQLSGGQAQRVAMGRAIVRDPALFLLDEPLSNLDAKLRAEIRGQIASLQRRLGTTTVFVTHDQVEAMTLGHRVALLSGGRLQQLAPPGELYDRPASVFVARFVGSPPMNLFPVETDAGEKPSVRIGGNLIPLPDVSLESRSAAGAAAEQLVAGWRPEHLKLAAPGDTGHRIRVEIEAAEVLGHEQIAYFRVRNMIDAGGNTNAGLAAVRLAPGRRVAAGDTVELAVDVASLELFDAKGRWLAARKA
jgi:multiple sugar transport system ATP-binding protein